MLRACKRRCRRDIPGQIFIYQETASHPSRTVRFSRQYLSWNTFVQSGTVYCNTLMLFHVDRSLIFYFPVATVDIQGRELYRLPKGVITSVHTRYCEWVMFGNGVQIPVIHTKTEICILFSKQILSIQPILSRQIRWIFATTFYRPLLFPSLGILTPSNMVQSDSVECT